MAEFLDESGIFILSSNLFIQSIAIPSCHQSTSSIFKGVPFQFTITLQHQTKIRYHEE